MFGRCLCFPDLSFCLVQEPLTPYPRKDTTVCGSGSTQSSTAKRESATPCGGVERNMVRFVGLRHTAAPNVRMFGPKMGSTV